MKHFMRRYPLHRLLAAASITIVLLTFTATPGWCPITARPGAPVPWPTNGLTLSTANSNISGAQNGRFPSFGNVGGDRGTTGGGGSGGTSGGGPGDMSLPNRTNDNPSGTHPTNNPPGTTPTPGQTQTTAPSGTHPGGVQPVGTETPDSNPAASGTPGKKQPGENLGKVTEPSGPAVASVGVTNMGFSDDHKSVNPGPQGATKVTYLQLHGADVAAEKAHRENLKRVGALVVGLLLAGLVFMYDQDRQQRNKAEGSPAQRKTGS